jgi:hypothetical protein
MTFSLTALAWFRRDLGAAPSWLWHGSDATSARLLSGSGVTPAWIRRGFGAAIEIGRGGVVELVSLAD